MYMIAVDLELEDKCVCVCQYVDIKDVETVTDEQIKQKVYSDYLMNNIHINHLITFCYNSIIILEEIIDFVPQAIFYRLDNILKLL